PAQAAEGARREPKASEDHREGARSEAKSSEPSEVHEDSLQLSDVFKRYPVRRVRPSRTRERLRGAPARGAPRARRADHRLRREAGSAVAHRLAGGARRW